MNNVEVGSYIDVSSQQPIQARMLLSNDTKGASAPPTIKIFAT